MISKRHLLLAQPEHLLNPLDAFAGRDTPLGNFGPSSTGEDLFRSCGELQIVSRSRDLGTVMLRGFFTDRKTAMTIRSGLADMQLSPHKNFDHIGSLIGQVNESAIGVSSDFIQTESLEVGVANLLDVKLLRDRLPDGKGEQVAMLSTVVEPWAIQELTTNVR